MTMVSIAKSDTASEAVRKAVKLIGGMEKIVNKGEKVFIKPNLVAPLTKESGAITDPEVTRSVIQLVREAGASSIMVGDAPFFFYKSRRAFEVTGTQKVVEEEGVEAVYIDEDEYLEIESPKAKLLNTIRLPKSLLNSDKFITVPKLKTHSMCRVSLAIKNQIGLLSPEQKQIYHRTDIHQKVVDVTLAAKPDLAIIDGLNALEGQGPTYGDPVDTGIIISGMDVVSVDSVGSIIMGFEPQEIPHIRLAALQGLGEMDLSKIEVKGESIDKVQKQFKRPLTDVMGVFPNVEAYVGCACNEGCLAWTRVELDRLRKHGLVEKVGKVNLVIGHDVKVPERLEGRVYIIGDCAEDHKEKGIFVKGCPAFQILGKIQPGE
ncbi:MAG: DUF362 domain-containing protein [Candidatus Jordarchaeum sp.]|uniref:DUF362 domain-containing protein n=1 Tax=Candidatus Jordarchaeum sp. TaxID=2823881 RepID=UPI00404951BC